MAVPKRHRSLPGTYFVTSRTWESRKLFTKPTACEIFVNTLLQYRDRCAYQLHGFVLMPEHFHVLITPASDVSIERAVQLVKGGSAHRIGAELGFKFPVWQRGFSDHRIRDGKDYSVHLTYLEQNPVKRSLSLSPQEFVFSSACGRYVLDDAPQRLKPLESSKSIVLRHG